MVVDFSKVNLLEQPVLILKNAAETPLGVLGYAFNITADIKYNEASVLEFTIPAYVDGEPTPYYDDVVGLRVIDYQDVGQFILVNPTETGDGIRKTKACKAYSLEYELSFKKIFISEGTYNFWNPAAPGGTLIDMILELLPSWRVGDIAPSLIGKYRTFAVSNENIYNFIKSTVQQSYNCIFDFDTYTRTINVRDASAFVETNPVYISLSNLAKQIDVEERTEEIITRLDVNGAEGVTIRDVNPSGTNNIINLDYFMNEKNFGFEEYNQWDEEWESGGINGSGIETDVENVIRSKNYIPVVANAVYTFKASPNINIRWYDKNKAFISYATVGNGTRTAPANAAYLRFQQIGRTEYENDILITVSLITKYYKWKEDYEDSRIPYYNLSVEYALQITRRTTEEVALTELQGELTNLENQLAVIIRAESMGLNPPKTRAEINQEIAEKKAEIAAKNSEIESIAAAAQSIYEKLVEINRAVNFKEYFTDEEYLILDRYIKDESISESSFVFKNTVSYTDDDISTKVADIEAQIQNAELAEVKHDVDKVIYDIKGGHLTVYGVDADIIKGALERNATDDTFVMTAYLGHGTVNSREYNSACVSLTGSLSDFSKSDKSIQADVSTGFMYFTYNTSEYERRAVGWDLYDYGADVLEKLSQPSYQFTVSSANFLSLDEFVSFGRALKHGQKVYLNLSDENGDDRILSPILTGARISYEQPNDLTLEFGNSYTAGDSTFRLADLLEQSIAFGRNADFSKYTYSAFVDSGANTQVRSFMTSALDVARNAIISSKDQAISWDDAGIRLRMWNSDRTGYDDEQIWMNNNSILMTDDNWESAKLAIGSFHDTNKGDMWGIVAPNIVGTLLAGENLVIESEKKDGGVSVFKVDAEGCVLHNADLSLTAQNSDAQILMNAILGIAIGKYPLTKSNGSLDEDNAKFWVDTDGNVHFKGTLEGADGSFTGTVNISEGATIAGWKVASTYLYSGSKTGFNDDSHSGIYMGQDGIALGSGSSLIKLEKNGKITANNVSITGSITATSGTIGGCPIVSSSSGGSGSLQITESNIQGKLSGTKIASLSADQITSGSIDASKIAVTNLNASNINTGQLNAGLITTGTMSANRISGGTIDANNVNIKNIKGNDFQFVSGYIGSGVKLGSNDSQVSLSSGGISHSGGASMLLGGTGASGTTASISAGIISLSAGSTGLSLSGATPGRGDLTGNWYGTLINSSDRNKKNSIAAMPEKYDKLFDALRPVTFKYNNGTSDRTHTGFVSQEVGDAIKAAGLSTKDFAAYVATDTDTPEYFLRYDEFVALNTWEIQKLKNTVKALQAEILELKGLKG